MTARYLFGGLCFSAAICAAIAGFMKYDTDPQTDFRHFAYRPLAQAEEALQRGDYSKSLELYKTALTRAARCSRQGVETRIRWRIASAGIEISRMEPHNGWEYFEYYALLSDNFDRSSSMVENWCLSNLNSSSDFLYRLVRLNNPYTIWGSRFTRVPNFTYGVLYEFFPKSDTQEKNQKVSYINGLRKTWRVPISVKCPKGIPSTKVVIKGLRTGQRIIIETGNSRLDTLNVASGQDGTLAASFTRGRGSATIWQIVAQCDYGENLNIAIELVKEYEQF